MTYSSGIILNNNNDLFSSQINKNDSIIKKLDIQSSDRILEVGSVWGCFLKIKEPGVLLFIDDDGKEIEVAFSYRNYEACFLETNGPTEYVLK
jgi:hypothetical protein